MSKEILCTLGPASYSDHIIRRLDELGVSLFRINLSHTPIGDLEDCIAQIRRSTSVPICLDTEGAQIRTGNFVRDRIEFRENSTIRIHADPVPGDGNDINLYPADIVRRLEEGDFILIDFNSVLVQVIGFENGHNVAVTRVINGGAVGRNKAVTVHRDIALPPISDKDAQAVSLGRRLGIRHVALSFANRGSDVDLLRELAGPDCFLISKIESLSGISHLAEIAAKSDAILIDRGDLSRQLPLERIPRAQKMIIGTARKLGRKVYVATNLLESMVTEGTPTRAEVNDVYNTLLDGADGLVLAAETAIGANPVASAAMIVRLIREFEKPSDPAASALPSDSVSLLIPPHGGQLVERELPVGNHPWVEELPRLTLGWTDLLDCEQIAHGTYSPIEGFMDRETLDSVLADCRLPGGAIWTLPILLQVDATTAQNFSAGDRIALASQEGTIHAVMDVSQIFTYALDRLAQSWFGTTSHEHPGVARLNAGGGTFIAGPVTLVTRLPSVYRHFELTPAQTRFIFAHKGWSRVVGFHTRNPPHRAHEFIQLTAMHKVHADGLYISPVIGPKKRNDFLPDPIMRTYQLLLEFGIYPPGRAVLGCLSTYSRYCGPREAVFTALCRKNMGCSHFIIGRDHTGIGDFYPPDANRRMFDSLGDLGVEIVHFPTVGYSPEKKDYVEADGVAKLLSISGTEARETLRAGKTLPDWFMRDIVQQMLRSDILGGRPVFVE